VFEFLPWSGWRDSRTIRSRRGFDVPISGAPDQRLSEGAKISHVAVTAGDYPGLRPCLAVALGDRVAAGDILFNDRRHPEMAVTAPGAGEVISVLGRDAPAIGQRVEIRLEGEAARQFDPPTGPPEPDDIRALLLESGLWPALRARPFGRTADPGADADAIFITAIDTNPLAADPRVIIAAHEDDFRTGVDMVKRLAKGPTYLCQGPGPDLVEDAVTFTGPHPAGLVGTHIHHLCPVGGGRVVWHLDYQDTIAVGHLFNTGNIWTERIVSLAGPGVCAPRLVRTRRGASLDELTAGELLDADMRVISGSVLAGRRQPHLGAHHLQVSVINEGWDAPKMPFPPRTVSTALNGTVGPLIPMAAMDRAMALGIPVVPMLRALSVGDRATAERLGCLVLGEEDMALFSFLCPGKNDYGAHLRAMLDEMEAEG
jgi:Na+-transporting NADH:ubiquinone oxidoreductase subunit A